MKNQLFLGVLFLVFVAGCGGNNPPPATGSINGKVVSNIQSASVYQENNFPVILTNSHSTNKALAANSNEKIIRFKKGLPYSAIAKLVQSNKGQIKRKIYGTENSYVITNLAPTFKAVSLEKNPAIEYIADNLVLHASKIPNDPAYSVQWNYPMLFLPEAWDIQTGAASVIIAVIDSGVSSYDSVNRQYSHPDLRDNLLPPVDGDTCNFAGKNNDPSDQFGHGTHVAGIISAWTNNQWGVTGVAWNVKIMPVKILDSTGSGSMDNLIAGINYAVRHGAKVINLSLGMTGMSAQNAPPDFVAAINYAKNNKVTIIAATGNENGPVDFPANYPGIIAVAALGPDGQRATYSNFGPEVTVTAPGGANEPITNKYTQMILSTYYDPVSKLDTFAYMSGTSMACPHISGLAALLYSQNPNLTPDEVKNRLTSYVIDKGTVGFDHYYGYGMPDAAAVLSQSPLHSQRLRVFVSQSNGTIEKTQYLDGSGYFNLTSVPAGNKYIGAFMDNDLNGMVNSGDKFAYLAISVQAETTITANLTLTDVNTTPVTLSNYLITVLH